MRISTTEMYITSQQLTQAQERQLLGSKNAMSAFVAPLVDPNKLPDSLYFPVYSSASSFLGAVHMERTLMDPDIINIHPMILVRDRAVFRQATELAILCCLLVNKTPIAKVLNNSAYDYMHGFLAGLGINYSLDTAGYVRVYQLFNQEWAPKTFSSYSVETK